MGQVSTNLFISKMATGSTPQSTNKRPEDAHRSTRLDRSKGSPKPRLRTYQNTVLMVARVIYNGTIGDKAGPAPADAAQ